MTPAEHDTAGSDEPSPETVACCRANWQAINDRVAAACRRAGRPADAVRVIGVTKYVGLPLTRAVLAAGCRDLGESRPQALWEKAAAINAEPTRPRWHLIGHLQRNKVAKTLAVRPLIHTVDSERLAVALSREAVANGNEAELLIEINLAGDTGRSGAEPSAATELVSRVVGLSGLRLLGLMGMASHPEAGRDPRQEFAGLRRLRDQLVDRFPEAGGLSELSMGMSGDFEAAILEGSTMVRIGSALFTGLE
jgi:pyridoxal phosphate enzyme (YggS family)